MAKVLVTPKVKPPKKENTFPILVPGPDGKRQRRLVPVSRRQRDKIDQWEIDYRFVREVERLERDGRVDKRVKLEQAVGLESGAVSAIRAGLRGVSILNVRRLFEHYRCDYNHIIFGSNIDLELSKPFISGLGRLNIHEPYYNRYQAPAKWRVGPRPETLTPHPTNAALKFSAYYPDDPDNEGWTAPPRINAMDFATNGAEDTHGDKDDE